ncbi:MAG: (d)CMP kinase [Alphaproteobacteria bacterium]
MIIAVDGPSAAGKGTLAKGLAAHYGLQHLDTGALYRAVALRAMDAGADPADEAAAVRAAESLKDDDLKDPRLRDEQTGAAASLVSAFPGVRAALVDYQRAFAGRPGGAVLDGRDIGTVICPEADVKLFVTASAKARAHRRALEMRSRGQRADEAQIEKEIGKRDQRDADRAHAPLKPAEDAHLLDTTNLDIEAALLAAIAIVHACRTA